MQSARLVLAALLMSSTAACTRAERDEPGRSVRVAIAPLSLSGVTDACYRLTVENGSGEVVWQEPGVCAGRYGDGRGSIAYVGPCDADDNDNTVRLELEDLFTSTGVVPRGSYQNPCGHADNGNDDGFAGCERTLTCRPNADVAVAFDIVLVRDAQQGFFDVAVDLADVFCSAKVDCRDELLHRPTGPDAGLRGPTVVAAFACTTGEDEPTWLHMNDLVVTCDGVPTPLDPHGAPGQRGPQSAAIWQFATYQGDERLPGLDKCYWNLAVGLDVGLGGAARNCHLGLTATASTASFGSPGATPPGAIYPFVELDVPLTNGDAAFVCGAHALNAPGSGVRTSYVQAGVKPFAWERQCGSGPPDPPDPVDRELCSADLGAQPGVLTQKADGKIHFAHDGAESGGYTLPTGLSVRGCCGNPCPGCEP